MLTRRSLLSMLAAGIASVAVSTRLAASELKLAEPADPYAHVGGALQLLYGPSSIDTIEGWNFLGSQGGLSVFMRTRYVPNRPRGPIRLVGEHSDNDGGLPIAVIGFDGAHPTNPVQQLQYSTTASWTPSAVKIQRLARFAPARG